MRTDAYGNSYDAEDVLDAEELADHYDRVRPGWRTRDTQPAPVIYGGAA